jgi:hypothetical protein
MTDKKEFSSNEAIDKIKQAANDFKSNLLTYFKEHNVEIKDWKLSVESSEQGYIIDASTKIKISPKQKE